MFEKRQSISSQEKQKYAKLIQGGANFKAIGSLYRKKHGLELARSTFNLWKKNSVDILANLLDKEDEEDLIQRFTELNMEEDVQEVLLAIAPSKSPTKKAKFDNCLFQLDQTLIHLYNDNKIYQKKTTKNSCW